MSRVNVGVSYVGVACGVPIMIPGGGGGGNLSPYGAGLLYMGPTYWFCGAAVVTGDRWGGIVGDCCDAIEKLRGGGGGGGMSPDGAGLWDDGPVSGLYGAVPIIGESCGVVIGERWGAIARGRGASGGGMERDGVLERGDGEALNTEVWLLGTAGAFFFRLAVSGTAFGWPSGTI